MSAMMLSMGPVSAENFNVHSVGSFDYVNGSDGYSGSGYGLGDSYFFNDNRRGSYTRQSAGSFDFITGPNGYSATGYRIGNSYFLNDNSGNLYTTQSTGSFDFITGPDGLYGSGNRIGNSYFLNISLTVPVLPGALFRYPKPPNSPVQFPKTVPFRTGTATAT